MLAVNPDHCAYNHGWAYSYEAFCICRHCHTSVVFVLAQKQFNQNPIGKLGANFGGSVNDLYDPETFISIKNLASEPPPEHLPANINSAFKEGAACMTIGCYNAAVTMFRLCVDHATKGFLPSTEPEVAGLTKYVRGNLSKRLEWLFAQKRVSEDLKDLSTCIREDGNDGAHAGTIDQNDAKDVLDFTFALLDRLYSETKRVELANLRRIERRKPR
jgi:Domain of unknown function (DUF4145)